MINDAEDSTIVCSITGASNIDEFKALRLPYSKNTLSIDFSGIHYGGHNQATYSYRMKGADDAWITSKTGFVKYTHLAPGDYTFEVSPVIDGKNESFIKRLDIHIRAPYYSTGWFLIGIIVLSASFMVVIVRYFQQRREQIQKLQFEKRLALESERLRIASNMHDDLGSGISAISLRAKMLADQPQHPSLQKQLQELSAQTNLLSQQIRETIWTINSGNDTVDSLITKLHQYATDYFEGSGIQCEIRLMPELMTEPISGNHRREIYLSFKEALHNIRKHARANKVTINILVNDAVLFIQIHDNGIGFNPECPNNGLGITSMKNRIQSIGGQFNISSSGTGTDVVISYPL
jgi:signal transduction histidine kinase